MSWLPLTDDDLEAITVGVLPLTVAADLWRDGHYLNNDESFNDEEEA